MIFFPAAGVFLLVWLWAVMRSADAGIPLVIAVVPFGMFAAVAIGGLSLLLANLLAALTIGVLILRRLSAKEVQTSLHIPVAGFFFIAFALYSVFSAFVLVRIFQGQFLVFPMNVTYKSTQVSVFFPSTMLPLQPSKSNIAQSFYILLSCGFFLATVFVMRRKGTRIVEAGLSWGAGLNVFLGFMDYLGMDALLSFVRTADYTLANEQTVAGIARIIGGFAEASVFGAASAAFAGYFIMSFLIGRRAWDAALGLGNLIVAVVALSSTAFLGLGIAAILILLHARTFLSGTMSRTAGHLFVIGGAGMMIAICVLFLVSPAMDMASDLFDRLILSKQGTLSGLERAAWARAGIDAFYNSWGLGAGVGSLRGSGLASVLLGSVGLPGTIAFLGVVYFSIFRPIKTNDAEIFRTYYASRVCALIILATMFISATVPDPSLLLSGIAAVAVVSRENAAQRWVDHVGKPTRVWISFNA
ncbi:hypothetical protein N4R57_11585 [Rhodobacteraceae bacterium D3-12]|nr:hypothetical protein N4R57_11585 [Rhodobacteraceae bacterium D3-12]